MKILILGGTVFLGRHVVETALAHGHEVTLFNRNNHPEVFPDIELLTGDRDGQMQSLLGRQFDAVIDTSGYLPRVVRQSAELLQSQAGCYLFVSSISVYRDFSVSNIQEDYPTAPLENPGSEDVARDYGPLKALCEKAVQEVFGDRAMVVRPGLIVGPHDPTDRFTYWVRRFRQGGQVLVPGRPNRFVQFIDVRDLAAFMLHLVEVRASGTLQATGPVPAVTMGQFVQDLSTLNPSAEPVWVSEEFLLNQQVEEWSEIPLWLAEQTGWPGFMTADVSRAIKHGLTFRPLSETIRDTEAWDETRDESVPLKAGIVRDKEAALLAAWNQRPPDAVPS